MAVVRPAVAPASLPRHPAAHRRRVASLASMHRRGGRLPIRKAALDPGGIGMATSLSSKAAPAKAMAISNDLRLFAYTFLGGFVFVSVLIG